jgi:plasmid stability protein
MRLKAPPLPAKLLQNGAILEPNMPVNLSIKNAPDDVVERLRERAAKNHRSLQGELMAIIEDAVKPTRYLTIGEVVAQARKLGLHSPDESAAIVRADRDSGHRDKGY